MRSILARAQVVRYGCRHGARECIATHRIKENHVSTEHTLTSEDTDDVAREADLIHKHDLAARYVGRESWSNGLNTVAIFMAGAFFALYVPASTLSNEHGWLAWA